MKLGAGHNVQVAAINATSTAGDNSIVAADANNRIRVIGYVLVATAATTVTWKRGSTVLSGPMSLAANAVVVVPINTETAWFSTVLNEALVMTLGAGAVTGHIVYVLES